MSAIGGGDNCCPLSLCHPDHCPSRGDMGASLTDPPPKKTCSEQLQPSPPITPRRHWTALCHGFTGANWDADSTNPPQLSSSPFCPCCPCPPHPPAAVSGTNKLILCSCIWCQRAPFVRPEPAESGGFVQRLATAGRKMGTLSGRRLEEGGMQGWQPGPEVIGSWGQNGVQHSNLPPKPLPRARGNPGGGSLGGGGCHMSCPPVPSQQGLGYPRDGDYSSWESSAPCNRAWCGTRRPPPSHSPAPAP